MFYLGIDPGKKGALASFDSTTRTLIVGDMPLVPRPKGKKGEETNYALLGEMLRPVTISQTFCMIEDVWSMPREGVSSAHAFGRNIGALLMALAMHKIPHEQVTAAKWKKHYGLSSDKGASRALAMQRFPQNADDFKRVKDDGRAEAALLAYYAYQMHSQGKV